MVKKNCHSTFSNLKKEEKTDLEKYSVSSFLQDHLNANPDPQQSEENDLNRDA